ncbi:hypothetical protein AGOR_G00203730 [Albula goreensis]|uniref:Uncharacterized protein n=1 Tax=Albula goreensis TaxID=1534307 RepID=A0A8T3CQ29_9TELE|nr:hypothetical protein AGOR_G00203730 [Albula goreensis]
MPSAQYSQTDQIITAVNQVVFYTFFIPVPISTIYTSGSWLYPAMILWRLALLFACGKLGEASINEENKKGTCTYYVQRMEAKNMECFKVMGGNTVACNTEGVSTDLCCITQQFPYINIQWTTEVDITCKNETFDDQLTGTAQDCGADQESIKCNKKFAPTPGNQRRSTEEKKNCALVSKAGYGWLSMSLLLLFLMLTY